MTNHRGSDFGFAAAHDVPIPYLHRIRTYYQALGYGAPYEWARFAEVPFQRLSKPLSKCCVALITTAAPYRPELGDQGPGAPYNANAKFHVVYSGDTAKDHDLRISHVAIDRQHTSAEDLASYFPLAELRRTASAMRIGSVAPRFHGAPTNRSHRATLQVGGPEIVARCKADAVDAAVLVANCPVCHQTVGLIARMLEASGIATVVMGCAKDIVEHVGVPRLLFSDFPLGNAAGRPKDPVSQAFTLALALDLLEAAPAPRTSVQSPLRWSASPDWKLDYCNIERLTPEEITRRRAEFDQGKTQARRLRDAAEPGRRDEDQAGCAD
jgi:D-proline reductase (dithiol) PrdB